ncbi:uncharacterized protein LOC128247863 [Octopus bimaculoides]|uniref:uncharacterized protein LOC128247863 n=1 Tax=Octopus bimaculoides TaxID=37653 RepID=UPI0022E90B47|nr:uncharacterized protein LOC128247863 [Octopus bimaculoides]
MEFSLLHLKYLLIVQCFCVSLRTIDDDVKFVRKNQPVTFECPIAKQEIFKWQIGFKKIENSTWSPVKTKEFEANVLSGEVNILNITLLSNSDLKFSCQSTNEKIIFEAIPLFNNSGNLYPSSETPNAIKDKKFTLECKACGTSTTWYTGNGTLIAKYFGTQNQNKPKYFGSRQDKSCTLSITNVSLAEDNMSIICSTGFHTSMFNITVFYSPERDSMKLNVSGGKVCTDTPTKFQCSWKGGDPPASETLMYKNVSNTSKEEVELNVILSKSHQTVKCLGIHIAANVSHEKNLTIYYPPNKIQIEATEPFLEGHKGILHCKAKDGYPEKYSYRWDPNNNTSQNLTFPNISRTQNNKVFACYASNMCNKKEELHKTHWINVEFVHNGVIFNNLYSSIIASGYKGKGDALGKNNYKGIKLLDQEMKVTKRVIAQEESLYRRDAVWIFAM